MSLIIKVGDDAGNVYTELKRLPNGVWADEEGACVLNEASQTRYLGDAIRSLLVDAVRWHAGSQPDPGAELDRMMENARGALDRITPDKRRRQSRGIRP